MAPYVYRPQKHTLYSLEMELTRFQQELQRLQTDIARAKSFWSFLLFLLCPLLRPRWLHEVPRMRARVQYIQNRMQDLKEQQVALLFLHCWKEELANVPSEVLLGKDSQPPDDLPSSDEVEAEFALQVHSTTRP